MPRMTRAALRAQGSDEEQQSIFEDTDFQTTPHPSQQTTPIHSNRPIFGELTGNNIPIPIPESETTTILTETMPSKKARGKKTGKKANKKDKLDLVIDLKNEGQHNAEVLEDDNLSDNSDAADLAADELRKDERPSEAFQVPVDNTRPKTPPSFAAKEASTSLLQSPLRSPIMDGIERSGSFPTTPMFDRQFPEEEAATRSFVLKDTAVARSEAFPNTPKFDPQVHREEVPNSPHPPTEDTFVEHITTRSPTKSTPVIEGKEDSFVEDIKTRSHTKHTPRIEDSVAEMDALDDAIEKIAETLPTIEDRELDSPVLTRSTKVEKVVSPSPKRKTALTTTIATTPAAKKAKASLPTNILPSNTFKPSAPATRPSTVRSSTVRTSVKPAGRPSVLLGKQRAASSEKESTPALSFSASPAKTQPNTMRKRSAGATTALSTSKPGFVPAKSTKPPTTSSFKLPGEEFAARMKAQKEERLKREEEAAAVQKAVASKTKKPAPPVKSAVTGSTVRAPAVKPRETKTSQARQSLMFGSDSKADKIENKENITPVKAATVRIRPAPSATGVLTVKKRPSLPTTTTTSANSAKPRARPSVLTTAERHLKASSNLLSGTNAAVKKPATKAKGKEVFARPKQELEAMEQAKKEKEEAAKKARAEAAEHGRIASREWAVKRKEAIDKVKGKAVVPQTKKIAAAQ